MTIQEILEAHYYQGADFTDTENRCSCGHRYGESIGAFLHPREMHHAHLSEVLEKHMREREAGALESFVASQRQMLENMETFADEYDRDEVDRWCSVITNRAKEIREATNGR